MIRIGFFVTQSSGWTGGINYLVNLLDALQGSDIVRPVILTNPTMPTDQFGELRGLEVIRTTLLDQKHRLGLPRRIGEKLYGRAFVLESLLQRNRIDVLSHSGHLGPRASIPTIGWIPDFQHRRIPGFFSPRESNGRDRVFGNLAANCTRVVLSSEDALRDFQAFRPNSMHKARVFQFVSGLHRGSAVESRKTLLARHAVDGPYFFLPNQFWAHKNHAIVIDALGLLRRRGRPVTVLATGNTRDYRHPDHFARIERRIFEQGVEADFRILGLVPLADVGALMQHAIATINPSLFEGWSTTVEEGKTLGKTIVASDIPVHREQAPEYGVYFNPKSAEDLAEKLLAVADGWSEAVEVQRRRNAASELPRRMDQFRSRFEAIAIEAKEAKL